MVNLKTLQYGGTYIIDGIEYYIDNSLYPGDILCKCVDPWLKEANILLGVLRLTRETFSVSADLERIFLPHSITDIGYKTFAGLTKLKEVVIPNTINYIGENAFEGCTSLKDIRLPRNLEAISPNIFEGCTELNKVLIHEHLQQQVKGMPFNNVVEFYN